MVEGDWADRVTAFAGLTTKLLIENDCQVLRYFTSFFGDARHAQLGRRPRAFAERRDAFGVSHLAQVDLNSRRERTKR